MKVLKGTKKLANSIICLIVSFTVCVMACFAWFALNDSVSSSGLSSAIVGDSDVKEVSVTAYYLTGSEGSGYTNTKNKLQLNSNGSMLQYGNTENDATAVLLEVDYSIDENSTKVFKLSGTVDKSKEIASAEKIDSQGQKYLSSLSNVVSFWQVQTSNNKYYPISSTSVSYVNNNSGTFTKNSEIDIVNDLTAMAGTQTIYLIMDYNSELFGNVFSQVLQKGGNISSALNFQGDVNLAVTVDESTGDDSSSLKDVSVNINDLALTSSADGLAIADGITVNGNTSIVSLNNGIAYTPHGSILSFTPNKVLKFSNSITKSYVTITTQAKATIYVYSSSSSATASRQLRIKDDNATLATADIGTSTEISEVIFTVDSAGTYYIGSVSSSIYIYYIAIVY